MGQGTALWQVKDWEPKHSGQGSVCTGVGGRVVVATGAAWVWGRGAKPTRPRHDGVSQRRQESRRWMAWLVSVQVAEGREPHLPPPRSRLSDRLSRTPGSSTHTALTFAQSHGACSSSGTRALVSLV